MGIKIASKMEFGKDKLKYVVSYGIAPLKKHISELEWLATAKEWFVTANA